MIDLTTIVGQRKEEALKQIKEAGFVARIIREDGESFFGTCDARTGRVNLSIDGGVVVAADIG